MTVWIGTALLVTSSICDMISQRRSSPSGHSVKLDDHISAHQVVIVTVCLHIYELRH